MNLSDIKKIEDIKALIAPLREQRTKKINDAVQAANKTAIEQFRQHFEKAGFEVGVNGPTAVAKYGNLAYTVKIEVDDYIGMYANYTLTTPKQVYAEPLVFGLFSAAPGRPTVVHVNQISELEKWERELADVQSEASHPAPTFRYVERQAVQRGVKHHPRGQAARQFGTFSDLLQAVVGS